MNFFYIIFSSTLFCFAFQAKSQSNNCDSTKWAKEGTYKVIVVPGSTECNVLSSTVLPAEVLCQIEGMRKDDQTIDFKYNSSTVIRVFARKQNKIDTTEK